MGREWRALHGSWTGTVLAAGSRRFALSDAALRTDARPPFQRPNRRCEHAWNRAARHHESRWTPAGERDQARLRRFSLSVRWRDRRPGRHCIRRQVIEHLCRARRREVRVVAAPRYSFGDGCCSETAGEHRRERQGPPQAPGTGLRVFGVLARFCHCSVPAARWCRRVNRSRVPGDAPRRGDSPAGRRSARLAPMRRWSTPRRRRAVTPRGECCRGTRCCTESSTADLAQVSVVSRSRLPAGCRSSWQPMTVGYRPFWRCSSRLS